MVKTSMIQLFASIALLLWTMANAFTSRPLLIAQHDALRISHHCNRQPRHCCRLFAVNGHDKEQENESSFASTTSQRRLFLASLPSAAMAVASAAATSMAVSTSLSSSPALALNDDDIPKKTKILVLGGTGLVGAQVVRTLQGLGIETISTSRDGRDGTVALDFGDDGVVLAQMISKLASGCSAVISCVGTIGAPNDYQVNAGTALAAQAAKSVGVERFVYITVAPQVQEFARDIQFLDNYMKGKTASRNAVLASFPNGRSILIEPTFIYGGDSFNVNPPRVTGAYGKIIEGLLSSSPIRSVESILPPGIIKIALEPPVSAESVASAAVAGALGKSPLSILDSYDKIQQASAAI